MDFRDYDVDYNNYGNPPILRSDNNQHHQYNTPSDMLTKYRCVLLNYPANVSSSLSSWSYYTLWLVNSNPLYPPTDFTPLHHLIYQVSQMLLLVYVVIVRNSLHCLCLLLCYSVLQVLWGLVVLHTIDIFTWNSLIGVICGVKCVRNVCRRSWWGGTSKRRKPKTLLFSPGKSTTEMDQVYSRLFAPVRVTYKQFLKVVGCKRGFKMLGCGENYAVEKRSRVDSLGLLVNGRLVVSQGGKALHVILPFQFVDSPEYFGVATDELFQVTITALEESKLVVWHRDKLRLTIMNDEFLRVMFDHIIGRDVVRKLIQVSDSIMTTPTVCASSCSSSYQPTTTTSSSSPTGNKPALLTSLSQHHGGTTTTTTTTSGTQQQPQPIIVVRKDKYAYQPTYLTSLSEEKSKVNMDEEEEDDEEIEEETLQEDGVMSGNEKEPMLDDDIVK